MAIKVPRTASIPAACLNKNSAPHPEGYFGMYVVECNTAYRFKTGQELTRIYDEGNGQ